MKNIAITVALTILAMGWRQAASAAENKAELPWSYEHVVRTEPRLLNIHIVTYDLTDQDTELVAVVAAPDPDGDGPADTVIRYPELIVADHKLLVAINANAFSLVPDSQGTKPKSYTFGWPVTILGAAISDGEARSPAAVNRTGFWLDKQGRPHISPVDADAAWQAAAGFGIVLTNGVVSVQPRSQSLAPRSAVGFDRDRKTLKLVVVDGRQPGYSEGMSTYELGHLLRELGCHEGMNLDGGGSSALFVTKELGQPPHLVNKPSGFITRPIPVMLGIRVKSAK